MASSLSLLLYSSLFGFFFISAAVRPGLPFHPCNTLLVSTYSFSFKPRNTPDEIPNSNNDDSSNSRHPAEFFAVVTEVREFNPKPHPQFFPDGPKFRLHHMNHRPEGFIRDEETLIPLPDLRSGLPFGSTSSLRERTVDILNVLAALLFGAACGALTAGTMYLIWSLFNSRFESYHPELDGFSDDDYDNDDFEDEEDIFNPKKVHNNNNFSKCVVVVPAPPSATDSVDTALLKKESA